LKLPQNIIFLRFLNFSKEFLANAYYQSAGSFREAAGFFQNEVSGPAFLPAETGGLYPCDDPDSQEAQFGAS
jgi:hypothetical protein